MNNTTEVSSWFNNDVLSQFATARYFAESLSNYGDEFLVPWLNAMAVFSKVEFGRFLQRTPQENFEAYSHLLNLNVELFNRYVQGCLNALERYNTKEIPRFYDALCAVMNGEDGKVLEAYFKRNEAVMHRVLVEYPKAIRDIEDEYGFHFERYPGSLIAETDRFFMYQVMPSEKGVVVDPTLKPILIIPPFVLGANILGFLPGEKKSYAHAYANRSIPTYIRLMKDIKNTPAVQEMTLEENANDTSYLCNILQQKHGMPVTLNGYCQGGYSSLCNVLSGKLDGQVDALITCVAPMDGTRSKGLGIFLKNLPKEFNDLEYGTKVLDNGNRVADGELMGWIYKLKSIETSGPLIAFLNDIMMLDPESNVSGSINKTVAAINYWLANERSDLPLAVTEMSFLSYNVPIQKDGTLPVKLFGKELSLKTIEKKKIKWLLCYGEHDDLVEKEVALAPLDFIDCVEVTSFPKGHVAIATSWSHPDSSCALDTVFGKDQRRGPVRFQLDLSEELRKQN